MADSVKNKRLHNLDNYSSTEREYYQRLYAAQGNKSIALESGKTQRAVLGLPLDHVLVPGFADPMVKELKREYKMGGAMKEHGMVAYVLPVQIVIFGNVAIIACPGEFTNTAGKRVVEAAKPILKQRGGLNMLSSTPMPMIIWATLRPEKNFRYRPMKAVTRFLDSGL